MSRKEQIEQYIEKQTSLKIADNSFNFENCNAYIISLDLNINRTNVSRILNQLFTENRLIKIDGRPTLYISKTAIYENLQTTNLPSLIKKGENIKDYLDLQQFIPQTKQKVEIVGVHKNESLYFLFQRLFPYFMNPPFFEPLFLILNGEPGTGRKYFIEQLFFYAQKNKVFEKDQSIFYCLTLFENSIESICNKINPFKNPIIVFQTTSVSDNIYSYLSKITELYKNSQTRMPMIFLLTNIDKTHHNSLYFQSAIFNFPKLCKRPTHEIAELALFLFLRQAQIIHREIYITKEILLMFALKEYKQMNAYELSHYIYTFVSTCLYHSSKNKNNPVFLDVTYIPPFFKDMLPNISCFHDDIIRAMPKTFILKPTMRLNDIKIMTTEKSEMVFLPTPDTINQDIDTLILSFSTSLNSIDHNLSEFSNNLFERLQPTILGKDPQIILFLTNIIDDFITNHISLSKYRISKNLKLSSTDESIFKIIIHTINPQMNNIPLLESEKHIIKQIISHCVAYIQKTKIPVLIICHENNLSNNYAQTFNILSKSRKYYSIDYSKYWQDKGVKSFTENLYSVINMLNRGRGVILLVDYYPLTILDSKLVLNLKIPIFSFSPISLPLLYTIYNSNENEAISITTNIIKKQNTSKEIMQGDSLIIKNERISNIFLNQMKDIFPYLDTTKTNELLYKSLVILSEKLKIKMTNSTIIDYIFHGNCILNNIHLKRRNYPTPEVIDDDVLEMIKLSLHSQPLFSNIVFKKEELNILYNSIFINISIS